jgi:hypothetical protein
MIIMSCAMVAGGAGPESELEANKRSRGSNKHLIFLYHTSNRQNQEIHVLVMVFLSLFFLFYCSASNTEFIRSCCRRVNPHPHSPYVKYNLLPPR